MYFLNQLYTILNQVELTEEEKGLLIQASNDIVLNKRVSFAILGEKKREIFGKFKIASMYTPYRKLLEETLGKSLAEPYEDIEDEAIVF